MVIQRTNQFLFKETFIPITKFRIWKSFLYVILYVPYLSSSVIASGSVSVSMPISSRALAASAFASAAFAFFLAYLRALKLKKLFSTRLQNLIYFCILSHSLLVGLLRSSSLLTWVFLFLGLLPILLPRFFLFLGTLPPPAGRERSLGVPEDATEGIS